MHLAAGVADPQGALADETPKQIGQQTHELSVALCDRAESEKCPQPVSDYSDQAQRPLCNLYTQTKGARDSQSHPRLRLGLIDR
jgi:hypothetical protein